MSLHHLQHYIKITEFLGRVLGPDYEVALHDLTDKNNSLIAIANNHISGREVGAPLTDVALKLIIDRTYQTGDYRINYRGTSAGGKVIRSSTMFIKNEAGELIGLLCINFDNSRYREASELILGLCNPDAFVETNFHFDEDRILTQNSDEPEGEHFVPTSGFDTREAISDELLQRGLTADRLTQDEKMSIIGVLENRGLFLLKGAVRDAADVLCCSPASIYRYLSKVRTENEDS